jgi:hypothetical protein
MSVARSASLILAAALAACSAGRDTGPATPVAPSITITAAELPGSWGLASYRNEEDRDRTEAEAKSACGNPYKIGKGPNGGVMMYLADQTELSELFIKVDEQGWTYIGPQGDSGTSEDRVVTYYQDDVMITEWVDAGVRERYGTMVFVRCRSA